MKAFKPTSQQKNAIDYNRSMVITACPGSGKTAVVKEKIIAVIPNLPKHKGVVAITFTNKASQELKKKCLKGGHDPKQSFFGTIDSFCYKELILPFLDRLWGGGPRQCSVVKKLSNPLNSYFFEEYVSPCLDDIIQDNGFKKIYEDGFLWMNSFAALSLFILESSISARRYMQSRYSHVFVDEYQDSSVAQHELFMKLHDLGLVFTAVGDISQSIYEFRGGDSSLLKSLICSNGVFEHFEINVNHRCHPSIANYANRLMCAKSDVIDCDEIFVFQRYFDSHLADVGETVSKWIEDFIASNEWGVEKASDIAFLARKEDSLRLLTSGLKVNFRHYTDSSLDQVSSDRAELYSLLLSYRCGQITSVQEIVECRLLSYKVSNADLVSVRKAIKLLKEEKNKSKLISKFSKIADELGVLTNTESDKALGEVLDDKESLKKYMPINDNEVQVMTLHKSKGLEFKVVFHLDLEEWSFPFQRVINNDWNNPVYPTLSQDYNLHYVGITRAENCCILVNAALRKNRNGDFIRSNPSCFLTLPQLNGLYL